MVIDGLEAPCSQITDTIESISIDSEIQVFLQQRPSLDVIAGRLWEAAPFLIRHLLFRASFPPDTVDRPWTILELGSGTGFVGISLDRILQKQKRANYRILVSDLKVALPLIQENCRLNQCAERVSVLELDWTCPEQTSFPVVNEINQESLWILLSDCVYWRHLHKPLLHTLTWLCAQYKDAVIWLSYRQRSLEKETEFFLQMGTRFHIEIANEDRNQQLIILRCTLKSDVTSSHEYSDQWWQLCLGRIEV